MIITIIKIVSLAMVLVSLHSAYTEPRKSIDPEDLDPSNQWKLLGLIFSKGYLKVSLIFLIILSTLEVYTRYIRVEIPEDRDVVGEYYWNPGLGYEIKVFINEDGTWRKDIYENGILIEGSAERSGNYRIIGKVIKKAEISYGVSIVSFDDGKTGYLFNGKCFKGLNDDIVLQTKITTGDIPFPGINEGGGRDYCKK